MVHQVTAIVLIFFNTTVCPWLQGAKFLHSRPFTWLKSSRTRGWISSAHGKGTAALTQSRLKTAATYRRCMVNETDVWKNKCQCPRGTRLIQELNLVVFPILRNMLTCGIDLTLVSPLCNWTLAINNTVKSRCDQRLGKFQIPNFKWRVTAVK